jgi:hypothetical protein
MIGGLTGEGGFRRYEKGKKEAWGIRHKPASKSPDAGKSEVVVIFLSCDATYAPVLRCYAQTERPLKPSGQWRTGGRMGRCTWRIRDCPLHGCGRVFLARFWTSRGIFAQWWDLNQGFEVYRLNVSETLTAPQAWRSAQGNRDKDLKRMG